MLDKSAQIFTRFYLKHQDPGVCHSQAKLSALSVLGGVQADAVHLQPPSDFQQLVVRLRWSLPAAEERTRPVESIVLKLIYMKNMNLKFATM